MTVASKPKRKAPTVNDQITDSVTQVATVSITDLKKVEAAFIAAPRAPVIFESREKEPSMFDVMGIRPTRNFSTGRLEWEVPAEDVALFEQNHFVQLARVVRKSV